MIYNNLCGEQVSKMGIGIMRHNENDFESTQRIIDYSMSHGINYFESCYFYLNHHCEEILSKALSKYKRESYFLCGKMPVHGVLDQKNNTPEYIFNKQLKNCNTNYFDYYLIQAVDRKGIDIIKKTGLIDFLNEKKKSGFIRHLGFSFHDVPEVLEEFIQMNNWDCVQLQLNYYDWYISTGKDNYNIAKKYNLPIIVMGGVKGGTLTYNMPKEAQDILKQANGNNHIVEYAYKFLTTLSNVKVVLSGANSIREISENVNFFSDKDKFGLYKYEVEALKNAIEIYKNKNYIGCTNCGYCLQGCASHIKIGDIFTLYNKILRDKNDLISFNKYIDIQKGKHSSFECIGCGNCEKKCPQHLPIRKLFHERIFQLRM